MALDAGSVRAQRLGDRLATPGLDWASQAQNRKAWRAPAPEHDMQTTSRHETTQSLFAVGTATRGDGGVGPLGGVTDVAFRHKLAQSQRRCCGSAAGEIQKVGQGAWAHPRISSNAFAALQLARVRLGAPSMHHGHFQPHGLRGRVCGSTAAAGRAPVRVAIRVPPPPSSMLPHFRLLVTPYSSVAARGRR